MDQPDRVTGGWPSLEVTPAATKLLPRPLDVAIRDLVDRFRATPRSGSAPVSRVVLDVEPGTRELTLTLWVNASPDRARELQDALNATLRQWSRDLDDRTSDMASNRQFGFTVRSVSPGPLPNLEEEQEEEG